LLGEKRISGSPLSIKSKPNHFLLWSREFINAASQRGAREQNTP
jgi:hypothetical protein